jgi:tripartite ATP-independent transporter DctM subunit
MKVMLLLPFVTMVMALAFGVPIPFALGIAGTLGIWIVTGDWSIVMGALGIAPYSAAASYTLTTIPMFILMAHLASRSGIARELYDAAANWVSEIRGGLAIATVFACAVFGAMSGASSAAASVMGQVAMPNMRRLGYSESLAAGSIAVGATLDILIPPSIGLVVYGMVTETSIGKLLIAGVLPGIVVGICLCACILVWVWFFPSHAPKTWRVGWVERWKGLIPIWPALLLISMVMILLYTGIATPTEVGALGSCVAAAIGIALRRLNFVGIVQSLKETIRTTVMIFFIIVGANIFGAFMTMSQVPQQITEVVIRMELNRWLVITAIVVTYFIISMFMDEIPLMLLTLQVTFPLIVALGFDPIWYGIMTMMMVAMGLVFPPVGIVAFVVAGAAKVDLMEVYKGTSILVIAIVTGTILIMIFPQIVLWLPSKM